MEWKSSRLVKVPVPYFGFLYQGQTGSIVLEIQGVCLSDLDGLSSYA